jgi:hypothetical protein
MRGGTTSNRDSTAAGCTLPTSEPGPQLQQSEKPASSAAGGSGQKQERLSNPVGSAAGGIGTQRQCEEPSPSTTGGNAVEGFSLRHLRKKRETNQKRGSIVKIFPILLPVFSLTSSLHFLLSVAVKSRADLERELKELKCAIHNDTALREALEIQPNIVSFADSWRPLRVRCLFVEAVLRWYRNCISWYVHSGISLPGDQLGLR